MLTDGSGSHGISQLPSTTRLLEQVGARAGPVYGRFSDRDVYKALLQGATGPFEDVTRELAGWMCGNPVRAVVADSAEGYNPTHDLCRAMAGAADRRACAEQSWAGAICSRLTDAELERKLRAASEYEELTAESPLSIDRDGAETYRVECLHPVPDARPLPPEGVPYYERHGEARVQERRYGRVIRYRDHVEEFVELYPEVIAEYAALPARQTQVPPRTLRRALPRAGFRDRVRRVPGLGRVSSRSCTARQAAACAPPPSRRAAGSVNIDGRSGAAYLREY